MSQDDDLTVSESQPQATEIPLRLAALRAVMACNEWNAVVLPTGDPHVSEYPPAHWCSRAWFSGFSGSAGTLVVLPDRAVLWTDGRYTIQAAQQLAGTGIEVLIGSDPGCPKMEDWLCEKLGRGGRVVCDGRQISAEVGKRIRSVLESGGVELLLDLDPVAEAWQGRPVLPPGAAVVHAPEFAGESVAQKLEHVRERMVKQHATHYLVSSLDAVAWLLNIRGSDIPWTPLVLAYVLIGPEDVVCLLDERKCDEAVRTHLMEAGVSVHPYGTVRDVVAELPTDATLWAEPKRTCAWVFDAARCKVVDEADPVQALKAVKHELEIGHLRGCVERDSAAVAQFLCWVEGSLCAGEPVTELTAAAQLERIRQQDPRYVNRSFETIAAYGEHAALMHYGATATSDVALARAGFFLVDSGGQYLDGTTDVTRTHPCGELTEQQRRDYTLVLKGHIGLSRAVFLHGTTGSHLDILARGPLAREGLDYRCGTGHGVGYCLGVHEGPHCISGGTNSVKLEPGMIVTNEPGVYREGEYGIRIENMLLIREQRETPFGRFLAMEPLTCCPIDARPVVAELLSDEEREWLNAFNAECCRRLATRVDSETAAWMRQVSVEVCAG